MLFYQKNEIEEPLAIRVGRALSEGDFYEAGNLAGVLGAPVIFLCVNNQWAISTPVYRQTAAESFAAKAAAFGFPGVQVDGNDVDAVYDAVQTARERALTGQGPTLIEAVVYRLGPHTTADDPTRYVPADEIQAAQGRDPVLRLCAELEEAGLWNAAVQADVETEALTELDAAFEAARATPLPVDAVLDHCFTEDTQRIARQRAALLAGADVGAEGPIA